jgi:phosphoserine phosphatase RsbU/P
MADGIDQTGTGAGYGALLRLAGEISREARLDGLLVRILERSRGWIQVEACSIFLPDPQTGELVIHSARGDSAPVLGTIRVPKGAGIVGCAMQEKRLIRVDDVDKDPRFFSKADKQTGWKTRAVLTAPLLDGEECLGVIQFLNPVGRPAFTTQDEEMMEYFAGLVAAALVRIRASQAALERAQIQRDLDLARQMQAGLLPGVFPTREQAPKVEIHALLDPAKEVSGDLYDFFPVGDREYAFVVGDVSGKGVAAGLFMAVTRTLIRAITVPGRPPAEILQRVNTLLCAENPASLFVTLIVGLVDTRTGRVVYGQGGHNPPVRIPGSGTPGLEPPGGIPLGMFEEAEFGQQEFDLAPGDALLVYTDGVTEAMDPEEALFGEERLLAVAGAQGRTGAEPLNRAMVEAVRQFARGAEQSDDITLLTLRHLP